VLLKVEQLNDNLFLNTCENIIECTKYFHTFLLTRAAINSTQRHILDEIQHYVTYFRHIFDEIPHYVTHSAHKYSMKYKIMSHIIRQFDKYHIMSYIFSAHFRQVPHYVTYFRHIFNKYSMKYCTA
jgi:hypothetical protein